MTEEVVEEPSQETERYELQAELEQRWELARREFFDFVGSGIVVIFTLDQVSGMQESGGRRGGPGVSLPQEIGVWLHVGEDGRVTGYTGKVEVGQGIRTSLTQVIAEELPVSIASIELVMGDTDISPFDSGTAGSRTTPIVAPQIRKVAAAAREILLDLAAQEVEVDRASLFLADGKVIQHGTDRVFSVAELVTGQKLLRAVGEETVGKSPAEWWATMPIPKLNAREMVTGRHRYTSDLKRPGMLYGKVLRAPSVNARRITLDTSAAEAIPNVTVIRDEDFVGVVAPDALTATRAIEAIHVEWEAIAGQPSTHEVYDHFRRNPSEVQGWGGSSTHTEGSVIDGLAESDHVLNSTYTVSYIAHAPLEPRAAVAEWSDDTENSKLTVWTGTQRPFGVRSELAEAFGISEGRIRVLVPDTGSGYGGKHTGDAAIEAARLARGASQPVKLVWTREEEFTYAYFRPAGVIDIRSGVRDNGMLTAWEHHNYNSGASAMRTLYRIPHQHIEFHPAKSPLRQGSYRALAATSNHFARECHMDELAYAVQMDPLAFRLKNLDDERLHAVLEAAAEKFVWNSTKPLPHHGFGIAGGHEKGSYVATCAEVVVDPETNAIQVIRAVTAFECGAIINPDNVRNQVDGAVIMGLGGALFERIQFADGKILNPSFSHYRLPRFSDIPTLETVLLDRKDLPSVGAGETPIVAIAPAISNAIFNATSIRLRSLPLAPR